MAVVAQHKIVALQIGHRLPVLVLHHYIQNHQVRCGLPEFQAIAGPKARGKEATLLMPAKNGKSAWGPPCGNRFSKDFSARAGGFQSAVRGLFANEWATWWLDVLGL